MSNFCDRPLYKWYIMGCNNTKYCWSKESWKEIQGITGTITIDPTDHLQNSDLNTGEEISEVVLEDPEILNQETNTKELMNTKELDIDLTEEGNLTL